MGHIIHSPHFVNILNDKMIDKLHSFNIRHVEQLASLLLSPTGRRAFDSLKLSVDVEKLEKATDKYLQTIEIPGMHMSREAVTNEQRPRNVWLRNRRGMGYRTPEHLKDVGLYSEISNDEIKSSVQKTHGNNNNNYIDRNLENQIKDELDRFKIVHYNSSKCSIFQDDNFPQAKDQEYRGTCVAFATLSILESFINNHVPNFTRSTDFSEQYLYYNAKKLDGNLMEDGTQFEYALQVLQESGICSESHLPYRGYNDWSHSLLFESPHYKRAHLDKLAKGTRIDKYFHLSIENNIVDQIKNCILRNLPVGIGVLVFQDAWENDYTLLRGEIGLPVIIEDENGDKVLMDNSLGAHAICIVGFEDDLEPKTARPGGGGFIFRNSWGQNWAPNSEDARGYGRLPYQYVTDFCVDACIITKITE
jgi:C1A family cysteine protease